MRIRVMTTTRLITTCLGGALIFGCGADEADDPATAMDDGQSDESSAGEPAAESGADVDGDAGEPTTDDSGGEDAPPPFGGSDDVERAAQLWQDVQGYGEWAQLPGLEGIRPGGMPHGAFVRVFTNDVAAADLVTLEPGSVLLKENFGEDDESTLGAITVMARVEGYEPEAGDWFWAKYLPDGSLDQNDAGVPLAGRIGLGASMGCIACHSAADGDDFVWEN